MSCALYLKGLQIIWAYFLCPKMLKDAQTDSTLESMPARVAAGVFDKKHVAKRLAKRLLNHSVRPRGAVIWLAVVKG